VQIKHNENRKNQTNKGRKICDSKPFFEALDGTMKHIFTENAGAKILQTANRLCSGLDRYAGKEEDEHIAPLFVVGLPRSGTTLVYELIVQAFDVSYFTKLFEYTYGLPNLTTRLTRRFTEHPSPEYESSYGRIPGLFSPAENSRFWLNWFPENPLLGHYVPSESLSKDTINEVNQVIKSITQISNKPYVFKNVYFSLSINSLLKTFSHARIVVVRRDLEAVAASLYNRRSELHGKRSWWSVKPPFFDTVINLDLLEQVAFQCIRTEQLIEHALAGTNADRCFTISYAEVCNSPRDFISRLANWIGPTFRERADSKLPEYFKQRSSAGFPAKLAQRLNALTKALQADENDYFSSIAQQVQRPAG